MGIVILLTVVVIMALDLKKIDLTRKPVMAVLLCVMPHIVIAVTNIERLGFYGADKTLFVIAVILLFIYLLFRINIMPIRLKGTNTFRLRAMRGGRQLILYGAYCEVAQILIYIVVIKHYGIGILKSPVVIADVTVTVLFILLLLANGMIRILLTSKWLSVIKRLICVIFMWTPVVNLLVMYYLCHIAFNEYDYECYKLEDKNARVDSNICATKYPIVLIHGVGFRDARYFNYWGRIPKELKRQGAKIYYGHQQGWGTIEDNAQMLKDTIEGVLEENKCDKVNIIAHSKGGLDSRYMISKLGMAEYVATLTTMSTPHRGVKMVDILIKLPSCIFDSIAKFVNNVFAKYGDKRPDFKNAVISFTTKENARFNEEVKDVDRVYYQSYGSVMKNILSDYILWLPYLFIKITDSKDNDGLVSVESSKWGEFKGVLRNKYRRGISHGDLIDLKRESYRGFDVVEFYVHLVEELKKKGY